MINVRLINKKLLIENNNNYIIQKSLIKSLNNQSKYLGVFNWNEQFEKIKLKLIKIYSVYDEAIGLKENSESQQKVIEVIKFKIFSYNQINFELQ